MQCLSEAIGFGCSLNGQLLANFSQGADGAYVRSSWETRLNGTKDIAVGPDGAVYVSDNNGKDSNINVSALRACDVILSWVWREITGCGLIGICFLCLGLWSDALVTCRDGGHDRARSFPGFSAIRNARKGPGS